MLKEDSAKVVSFLPDWMKPSGGHRLGTTAYGGVHSAIATYGTPAVPCVTKGDRVVTGQLVHAAADGFVVGPTSTRRFRAP